MMDIIDFIPYGHDNAVTRSELISMTGESDRAIRDAISNSKELIINLQDGAGYFRPLPEEAPHVEHWVRIMKARIREEYKRIAQARRWANP